MEYFIGIHTDYNNNAWLEKVRAKNAYDAFDQMERNDTNLQVLPEPVFKGLSSTEVPIGQMVKVG